MRNLCVHMYVDQNLYIADFSRIRSYTITGIL